MGNRAAKFISTLFASIIAGAPFAAVSQNAPSAPPATTSTANTASDCLASPKGVAPQGQHWYYRLERATKRQCWYLRAGGTKAVQTAQAAPDATTTDAAAPPQPHSVQDARAEYVTQQIAAPKVPAQAASSAAPKAPSPATDGNIAAPQPAVTTRWPDAAAAAPAPQAAPAEQPVAAAQPAAKPAKSTAPVALAAADATPDKPVGSLPTLLLVVGGALALAGLLASIIYRFAGGRARVPAQDHRRVNWDHREPHDLDDSHLDESRLNESRLNESRAPWLNETSAEARAQRHAPIDFDAAPAQVTRSQAPQIAAFSNEISRIAALSRLAHRDLAHRDVAELDEADIFDGEFEIETSAPRLAVNDAHEEEAVDEQPVGQIGAVQTDDAKIQDLQIQDLQIQDVQIQDLQIDDGKIEDTVDVDVITAMLERLAQEGPRLRQPSPEADLADFARSPRGQSAARA